VARQESMTLCEVQRVMVVTGSSYGIGRELVCAMVRKPYRLGMLSRTPTQDSAIRRFLHDTPDRLMECRCDVSNPMSIKGAVETIMSRWGRIDGLVNNAGYKLFATLREMTTTDFQRAIATNLCGPFYLCKEIVPIMLRQGFGRIVNMSSRAGLEFYSTGSAYCASKAGLIAFSRSLADELEGSGITVNVLCPSTVLTEEYRKENRQADNKRLIRVEKIVRIVLRLLEAECHETGRVFPLYSGRALMRSVVLDFVKYAGWFAQFVDRRQG
jgi:3-oxoacyl-[acyl-carrier protein] reductase